MQDLVDVFYITEINDQYKCDTFFNLDYVKKNFKNVEEIKKVESTETIPAYTIKEYTK